MIHLNCGIVAQWQMGGVTLCVITVYSETSDNGPSEILTTTRGQMKHMLPIDSTIQLYEPPRRTKNSKLQKQTKL